MEKNSNPNTGEIPRGLEQNIRFDLLHMENQKIAKEFYNQIIFVISLIRTLIKLNACEVSQNKPNRWPGPGTSIIDKYSLDIDVTPESKTRNFKSKIIQQKWD